MKCQLVLRKFDLNLGLLKSKINALKGVVESDFIKDRLNVEIDNYRKLKYFKEIERILIFEKDMTSFSQESLRESVLRIAGKFKDAKIKIKVYNARIPENAIKKKIIKLIKFNEDSENNLLIEVFNDKGMYYRILSFKNEVKLGDKNKYRNLSVLLEHPRLVEDVSDVLRLCLIFGFELKVIHNNKSEFLKLLNKAKSITKGKLSEFNVDVYRDLNEIKNFKKIGFSKNGNENEEKLKSVFKSDEKILLVFGNDTFGLSQDSRDRVDMLIHLTPDYKKPLKANQALAYILGVYYSFV